MELLFDMFLGIAVSVGIGLLWVRFARRRSPAEDRPHGDESAQALGFSPDESWDWDEEELPTAEAPVDVLQEDLPPVQDLPVLQVAEPGSRRLRVELRERAERIDELERAVGSLATRFRSCLGRDPDSLQILRGIGPGYEKALSDLGIRTVPQLAGLTMTDLRRLKQQAPTLYRRLCARRWVEQARTLMQGNPVATS